MSILFADRLLAGLPVQALPAHDPALYRQLDAYGTYIERDIQGAVIIRADEVAEFYYAHKDSHDGKDPQIFANMAIPFEKCFVEFRPHEAFDRPRAGCMFRTEILKNRAAVVETMSASSVWKGLTPDWDTQNSNQEDHFVHVKADAVLFSKHHAFSPAIRANFILAKHGGLAVKQISSVCIGFKDEVDTEEVIAQFYIGLILPAVMAFTFMNCRNVVTRDNEPEQKLSRSWQKRNGRPLTTYKTLEIEPMKEVLETEGGIGHNGLKKALHICRGHFATYTPEKGMLGRKLEEPVTVWKPAHVRGSKEFGEVKKDYRVKI